MHQLQTKSAIINTDELNSKVILDIINDLEKIYDGLRMAEGRSLENRAGNITKFIKGL